MRRYAPRHARRDVSEVIWGLSLLVAPLAVLAISGLAIYFISFGAR